MFSQGKIRKDLVMKKTFSNIVNYNQIKQLKKINVSTLLVWGTLDKETPFYLLDHCKI